MTDELLPYYERELAFIRQMAGEFREKYPAVAGRIQLEPNTCDDPHVERLIEAFALLAGRIHHKLDDEFPEITEALLDVCIHTICGLSRAEHRPIQLDPAQSAVPAAMQVPLGTPIHSKPDDGHVCSFRTCYPVDLWPLRVTQASVSAPNRFASSGNAGRIAQMSRPRFGFRWNAWAACGSHNCRLVASGFTFREQAPRRMRSMNRCS